jgi:hypothetical protein
MGQTLKTKPRDNKTPYEIMTRPIDLDAPPATPAKGR